MRAEIRITRWQAVITSKVCSLSAGPSGKMCQPGKCLRSSMMEKFLFYNNSRSMQRSMFIAVYFLKNPNQAGMT